MRFYKVILLVVLLFAAVLRLYCVTDVPPSIYWEEAALGYDAYSILRTGKDYHGNSFPILAFSSFGDYKPSLYFYALVPSIAVFGLTEFAVRFPSILIGVFSVLAIYFLGKELFGKKVGLLAAALLAIQPWSMHLSRVGFETNLATFLILFGLCCIAAARRKPAALVFAALALGLSTYAYHAARITAPLVGLTAGLLLFGLRNTKEQWRWAIVAVGIAAMMLLPILMNLRSPVVAQRAAETSIFSDLSVIEESNAQRAAMGNTLLSRVIYHRYALFGSKILANWTRNFSLSFLFLEGDDNIRHQAGEFGLLYHWELIPVAAAIYVIVSGKKKHGLLILSWIAIAGIAPALTTVVPHTLRFHAAAPAFALLCAIGLAFLFEKAQELLPSKALLRATVCVAGLVILAEAYGYLHFYFTHYGKRSARDWQYGYRQLYTFLEEYKKPGQRVQVTREQGRPSIYYLFFARIDPVFVQRQDAVVKKDQQELLELGPYTFSNEIPTEKGVLVASSPEKVRASKILRTVSLPDGTPIWVVWETP